ncbi:hypothetical protein EF908_33835, partial [Streptomyces sp. WAC04770]
MQVDVDQPGGGRGRQRYVVGPSNFGDHGKIEVTYGAPPAEALQLAADQGRIRQALETLTVGLAAGSGGIALAQEIGRLVGL